VKIPSGRVCENRSFVCRTVTLVSTLVFSTCLRSYYVVEQKKIQFKSKTRRFPGLPNGCDMEVVRRRVVGPVGPVDVERVLKPESSTPYYR
jgi:hypothetical protein